MKLYNKIMNKFTKTIKALEELTEEKSIEIDNKDNKIKELVYEKECAQKEMNASKKNGN